MILAKCLLCHDNAMSTASATCMFIYKSKGESFMRIRCFKLYHVYDLHYDGRLLHLIMSESVFVLFIFEWEAFDIEFAVDSVYAASFDTSV